MTRRRLPIQTPGSDGRLDHQEGGYHGLPQAGVTPMPPTAHTHAESDVTGLVSDLAAKVPYTGATGDVDLGMNSVSLETLRLNLTPGVTPQVGEVFWDATNKCVAVVLDSQVTQQIGQESLVRVVNKTGSTLLDGTVVYVSTAQGNRPVAVPAKADAIDTSRVIGIVTEHILNNEEGFCTTLGVVNGYDTSGFSVGDKLYLSATTAGLLTKTRPNSPYYNVPVGIALNSTNNGAIFVHPQQAIAMDVAMVANTDEAAPSQKAVKTYVGHEVTKNHTGFKDPDLVVVDYDPSTRKVTLTGTVEAYYQGVQVTALTSGWVSDAHPAGATQPYFLYYNGSAFVWSTTSWSFSELMICLAVYDSAGTFRWALREPHGLMGHETHKELHAIQGTYLVSGGDLSAYTLGSTTAAQRRPDVSATTVADEDLPSVLPQFTSKSYTLHYLTGAGSSSAWTTGAAEILPVTGSQPYWNQFTGGAWQQTAVAVGDYACVFLVAVPTAKVAGADSAYRYLWLQGQTSGSLATVQAETFGSMNLGQIGSLSPEYVCIGKVIVRYIGGNWSITSVEKITLSKGGASSSGNFLTAVTTDTTLTGAGTATLPLGVEPTSESVRIRACVLTGLVAADGTIAATDTILQAFQKTEYRLNLNDAKVSFPGFGATGTTACVGNDARLSDSRTPLAHNQAWSTITTTPTTLAGYGITDAATSTHNHSGVYQPVLNGTGFVKATGTTISYDNSTYSLSNHNHSGTYQPVDADLTAIAALAGTSGFLKKTAADTWSLDTSTYLTGTKVDSFNTRTGAVTLTSGDVTTALGYTPINKAGDSGIGALSGAAFTSANGTMTNVVSGNASYGVLGTTSNHPLYIRSNNIDRLTFPAAGGATFGTEAVTMGALTIASTSLQSINWQRTGVAAKVFGLSSDNYGTYIGNATDGNILQYWNNAGGADFQGNSVSMGALTAATGAFTPSTYSGASNRIIDWSRTGGAVSGTLGYDDTNTRLYLGSVTGHSLALRTGNVDRVVIDAAGAVSMGALTATTISASSYVNAAWFRVLAGEAVYFNSADNSAAISINNAGGYLNINSSVSMGALTAGGGIRQTGTEISRFENTFSAVPAGATGLGVELGVNSGVTRIAAWNRTTGVRGPMQIDASGFDFQTGAATFASSVSMGALTATTGSFSGYISMSTGANNASLTLANNANPSGFTIQTDTAGDAYVWHRANRPMYIGTNGTTALTIAANQAATFASSVSMGALTVSGDIASTQSTFRIKSNTTENFLVSTTATKGIHSGSTSFVVTNQANTVDLLTITNTGAATFAGSVSGVTEATSDSSTKFATTAWVKAQGYGTPTGGSATWGNITGTSSQQSPSGGWSSAAVFSGSVTVNVGSAQGIFYGYGAGVTSVLNGEILLGNTEAYRGRISMDAATGATTMRFDSTYDNAAAEMHFRFRTAGTPVIPLKLYGSGAATFASSVTANGIIWATSADQSSSRLIVANTGAGGQQWAFIAGKHGVTQAGLSIRNDSGGVDALYFDANNAATFSSTVSGTSFNSITGLASSNPAMNSTVAVGTSTLVARQDHVHPVDTSRQAASSKLTDIASLSGTGLLLHTVGGSVILNTASFQPYDDDLAAIAAFSAQYHGLLKRNAAGVWSMVDEDTTYQPFVTAGTTLQWWRGDKTWQTISEFPGFGTSHSTAAYGDHTHTNLGDLYTSSLIASGRISGNHTATNVTNSYDFASIHANSGLGVNGNTAVNGDVRLTGSVYVGCSVGSNSVLSGGNAVIHAGNIGSQSVSYAATAGTAGTTAYAQNGCISGTVVAYASTTPPTGWLMCDGSAVSRSLYATLFGVVGTTFGAGDGSTTFNLPDLRARLIIGYSNNAYGPADGNGHTWNTFGIGRVDGEYLHRLTVDEMPSHTHSQGFVGNLSPNNGGYGFHTSGANNTGPAGNDFYHNNVPPVFTFAYIIKT